MKNVVIGLFLLAFVTTGCATLGPIQQSDIRDAIRIAVVLYIDGDAEKAAEVMAVVEKSREEISLLEKVTITEAALRVRQNILWDELEASEIIIIEAIISRVENAILAEIRNSKIPPDKLVLLYNVFDWIEDAAAFSQLHAADFRK